MHETLVIPSVTGIDLEMRIAGPGGRSFAFILDWNIRVLLAITWFFLSALLMNGTLMPSADELTSASLSSLITLPALLIYLFYHPVLEVVMRGRTPGKRMAGLRIVTLEGEVPGIGPILVRNVMRLLDSLPFAYVVGLTTTVLTRQSVRIGDLAAGTVLVYEPSVAPLFQTGIHSAALARLGVRETQLVQDLLERWALLDPPLRTKLAERLLQQFALASVAAGDDADLRKKLQALIKGLG